MPPRLPRRGLLPWALIGLLGFAAAAVTGLVDGVPRPVYHDELSYLLAADTFVHGRLTNPPHAHWQHFESYQVIHQPTYASKYPPGQGLVLALGTLAGGHPIVGVWLSIGLMAVAVGWMLRGFVPARWALFGAVLVLAQLGLVTYWSRSYWGGALAAAGGALVYGAAARLGRRAAARHAAVLGLGLLVLANTRPFEGLLASLPAAWIVLRSLRRGRRTFAVRGLVPLVLVLAAGASGMAIYNRAVTGRPLTMPYSVHEAAYSGVPLFVGQPLGATPPLRHEIQRRYHAWLEGAWREQSTFSGWLGTRVRRLRRTWGILLGPVLTLPWLLVPWIRRQRGVGLALAGVATFLAAALVTLHQNPHYAAPVLAALFLVEVQGWRRIAVFVARRRGRRAAVLIALAAIVACLAERALWTDPILRVGEARGSNRAKAEVEAFLAERGGGHLAIVRDGPHADIHDEWIANGAEIDAAGIVWARSMGPDADSALRQYYAEREAWKVAVGFGERGAIAFEPFVPPP